MYGPSGSLETHGRLPAGCRETLRGSAEPGRLGYLERTALERAGRGNDWHFADVLDGVGCSSFPKWFHIDDADFGLRIEFVRAAARGKCIWLSELQGGRSAQGFDIHEPVDALSQQRWIWNGLACGADTVLFWCWRDEVFGCESGGYGIIGLDGLADERVAAMRVTGRVLREEEALIGGYAPDEGTFGVLFSPQSYYYYAAQEGTAMRPRAALHGVCRALVRRSIPFTVVEEEHLAALDGLRACYLPRATALSERTEDALLTFVRNGGVLAVESECGAFNEAGLYKYPEDRFLAEAAGLGEVGRRQLKDDRFTARLDETDLVLKGTQWLTPLTIHPALTVHASGPDGALLASATLGKGKIIYCATYPSEAYSKAFNPGFEDYLAWIARAADCRPDVEVIEPTPTEHAFLYVKYGMSQGKRLVFVFFHADHDRAHLRFRPGFFNGHTLTDLISGERHELTAGPDERTELTLARPEFRFAVLAE